jgi:predicted ATP-grasp superfamily ATP-dependent carboligase
MTSLLVTDGDERAALAVVRSLGAAGHSVHVAGPRRRTLAAVSRLAVASFATPDPLASPDAYVEAVARYVAEHGISMVLPIGEPALLAVLAARERFGDAVIPFPSIDVFRAVNDKLALGTVAAGVGIACPPQWVLSDSGAAADFDLSAVPFPVVLKPSRSVGEAEGVRSKQRVRHARDASEFRAHIATLPAAAYPLLVQQRIVGPGQGVFLLRWNGATVAAFAHRRLLEKPPSGGVSVYAESIPLEPHLLAQSERLLAAFEWQGVAMIEYKLDAATGTPYLMEVNGRFWGSLQLAIDAGVDFPRLLVDYALGAPVSAPPSYRVGQRGRWWWGEVDHVLARLRRSDAELALPPDAASRGSAIAGFATRWRPGERDAVFRFADPLPFVYETVRWIQRG